MVPGRIRLAVRPAPPGHLGTSRIRCCLPYDLRHYLYDGDPTRMSARRHTGGVQVIPVPDRVGSGHTSGHGGPDRTAVRQRCTRFVPAFDSDTRRNSTDWPSAAPGRIRRRLVGPRRPMCSPGGSGSTTPPAVTGRARPRRCCRCGPASSQPATAGVAAPSDGGDQPATSSQKGSESAAGSAEGSESNAGRRVVEGDTNTSAGSPDAGRRLVILQR